VASSDAGDQSPWFFRYRAGIIAASYFIIFILGYAIQAAIFNSVEPTFSLLGRHLGARGIHAAAIGAATIVGCAYALRLWASAYHAPGVVLAGSIVTSHLTAAGPYRYTRNPLYLTNIVLALGVGLIGPPVVTLLLIAWNTFFSYRLSAIEEAFLGRAQGTAYERYCRAVPRMLPRFSPPDYPVDPAKPDWRVGFRTELFSLAFFLVMIYFAVGEIIGLPLYYVGPVFGMVALAVVFGSSLFGSRKRS